MKLRELADEDMFVLQAANRQNLSNSVIYMRGFKEAYPRSIALIIRDPSNTGNFGKGAGGIITLDTTVFPVNKKQLVRVIPELQTVISRALYGSTAEEKYLAALAAISSSSPTIAQAIAELVRKTPEPVGTEAWVKNATALLEQISASALLVRDMMSQVEKTEPPT